MSQAKQKIKELSKLATAYGHQVGYASQEESEKAAHAIHALEAEIERMIEGNQAIAGVSRQQVVEITHAYHRGLGNGSSSIVTGHDFANPYQEGSPCAESWNLGYVEGRHKAAQRAIAKACQSA